MTNQWPKRQIISESFMIECQGSVFEEVFLSVMLQVGNKTRVPIVRAVSPIEAFTYQHIKEEG